VLTALAERIGTLDRRVRASIDVDPVGMM
jgi:hypothetical protein